VKRHLLITAFPGAGKTTVIRRVAAELDPQTLSGFYTEEMRIGGERRGFRLVPFHGEPVIIAHVELAKTHRVGKYGVDVAAIDAAVEAALAARRGTTLYLIDEIGKMECLSERFVAAMRRLLDGKVPVVATVARRGGAFVAEVSRREDCELWTLTRANRDAMPFEIINRTH
jgi:nucleoside-triphosphatase